MIEVMKGLLLLLSLLVFSKAQSLPPQYSMIEDLIYGNSSSSYLNLSMVGLNESDNCQNGTHACQFACINGDYPPYGYTCKKSNGDPLYIYPPTIVIFKLAQSEASSAGLQEKITTINDVEVNYTTGIVEYVYGLNKPLQFIEKILLATIPSILQQTLVQQTGFNINAQRISVTAPEDNEIAISLQFPTEYVSVTWTSNTVGNILSLRNVVFNMIGLNASVLANEALEVNGYFPNNDTVFVDFFEDISQPPGTDNSYLIYSCEFTKGLYTTKNLTAVQNSGFSVNYTTLSTTDPTCVYPGERIKSNAISCVVFSWMILWVIFVFTNI